jgi:hypothetical protein
MGEQNGYLWTGTYDEQVHAAYRLIARHVYRVGHLGDFAYAAFEHINAAFFAGRLPEPLILWDITNYGKCLGWTRSPQDGPPIIKLHPSLVMPVGTQSVAGGWKPPWGLSQLGHCYAYDVLLHETVHAAVEYLHGGVEAHPDFSSKWTSHANPVWVAECNRIARIMGVDVAYDMKRYRRVPTGGLTKTGKPATKVEFSCDGPDPERFPQNLPGRVAFYRAKQLPFFWEKPRACCVQLDTTATEISEV